MYIYRVIVEKNQIVTDRQIRHIKIKIRIESSKKKKNHYIKDKRTDEINRVIKQLNKHK